ncbi:MAG: hypothetical protein PHX40_01975 [Bacilli bacterium]|nr:hypothetical protein [Bacilli bacterium]
MNYKDEMIKRYLYLSKISEFIYGYFMREETEEEKNIYKYLSSKVSTIDEYNKNELILIDNYSLYMLESLLFENNNTEDTEGYNYFENLINNELNKIKSKNGLNLKEKYNETHSNKLIFDVFHTLSNIYENISRQQNEIDNKNKKLSIIDEYIRISKYSNDSDIWRGGYYLDNMDKSFNKLNFRYYTEGKDLSPNRASYDVGIKNNNYINETYKLKFTEEEKKNIYFKIHDEIPYDKTIKCDYNGIYEIDRPLNSKPCKKTMTLSTKEIFSQERDNDYVFLTLCKSCGFIAGVESKYIPNSLQEEIIWNNKKDPSINEEAYLKSQIKFLKITR